MTTTVLGSFKKVGEAFSGKIVTLAWSAQIDILPIEGATEGSPAYRVYHAKREIGAGWVKATRKDASKTFLSLKLRDLAFGSEPVYPALVEGKEGWTLLLNGSRD